MSLEETDDAGCGHQDCGDHSPREVFLVSADDKIIADRAADGDVAAFTILVRRYGPMMRSAARRILGSSAEVDDVVQEAFITAWQKLDQLDDPAKVKAWLMRIASHRAIDRLRTHRLTDDAAQLDLPAAQAHSPARLTEATATVAALRQVLAELPQMQRTCWLLREVDAMSYREIAETLGLSESSVRGLLARARKSIIARMEQWQ